MRIERIDLYQIHRRDFLTHPHEVAASLTRMVEQGKVRGIGVSNHSPAEVDALQAFLDRPILSTQPEFSPLQVAPLYDGTLDQAMARGMAVLGWSPLGGGRLTDRTHAAGALLAEQGRASASTPPPPRCRGAWPTPRGSSRSSDRRRPSASAPPPMRCGSDGPMPNGMRCCRPEWARRCPERNRQPP